MAILGNLSRIILGLLVISLVRCELTCNFEEDTCEWKLSPRWIRSQEKSSNLATGPADDHVNPDGFYLHLNLSHVEPGEKSFVLSPPILNATKKYCLSFLYLMHGNQVGTLSVHVRNISASAEVWVASFEHRPEWLYQEVPIEYGRQVMFESVFGGQLGDIAIDDIAINEGECFETANEPGPGKPLPVKCTFEQSSICGYRNLHLIKWRLGSGSTTTRGTGPDNDHTLRTKKGHYMYLEASSTRHSGMKALLVSPKYTTKGVTCIQFWYNMYGSHINRLNVYVKKHLVWSRKGSQGYGWTSAFIERNGPRNFKLRFEGVTGGGSRGDIAIDDISIENGKCPPPVDCTFENTFCGWSDSGDDDFDWLPRTGKRPKLALGPSKDHTLQSEKGTYMIIESKSPRRQSDRARLVSTTISESVKPQCLQFWYNMNGKYVGELRIFVHTQAGQTLKWRLSGPQGGLWAYASLPIDPNKENFWFVIEGVVKHPSQSYIAFDDITLTKGSCKVTPTKAAIGGKPLTSTLPVKLTTPLSTLNPSKIIFSCEFTNSFCGWRQRTYFNVTWKRIKSALHPHRTSPQTDHTTGKGSYIYVDAPKKVNTAVYLLSPTITPKKDNMCLQFWFFMYGQDVDTLRVFISPGTHFDHNMNPHWKQSGSHSKKWILGKVNFQMKQHFQIVFKATVNGKPAGTIALDDILLTYGSCNAGDDITTPKPGITEKPIPIAQRNCDFESKDICGYEHVAGSPKYFWRRNTGETKSSGTGPSTDHSTNTAEGHYMYIEGSNQKMGTVARMITPLYKDSTSVCMQFYYHMYGSGIGNFSIYTADAGSSNDYQQIYFTSGNHGTDWEVNRVTIDKLMTASGYKIMFEATVGKNYRADIALDDVSFTAGECSFIGDCNFEDDSCTWHNVNSDDFDWELHSGKTSSRRTGPEFDHTRGNKNGHYMYIETSAPTKPGMKAKLVSAVLPKVVRNTCLQFWYNMYGNAVDSLKVMMQVTGYSKSVLWHLQGDQGKGWHFARVPLRGTATTYTITFEASSGAKYTGDIAIDDISFTENKCQISPSNAQVTTTAAPQITTQIMTTPAPLTGNFTCNFETDLCGWIQDKQDTNEWFRKSGPTTTRDTGPPGDHTTGKGHYIYLETTRQRKGSVANLISPVYQPDKTKVNCVSFWYYMYGAHVNKLMVYIQYGLSLPNSPIWSEEGNKGQGWHLGKFSFTSDALFNVVLSAVVGEAYDGDIAVDDVSIINGDCVDYITNAYLTCDFENKNICGFTLDAFDTYNWIWNHGGTPTASTGPNNDHTFGTPSGHYMYIKSAHVKGYSRLISPTIHTTYTSCVQFYYHMKGNVGNLHVYLSAHNTMNRIWYRSGHQSMAWQLASIEVPSNFTSFNIMFEATIDGSAYGDIALDDFTVLKGKCSNEGLCDFEKGMCFWQNTKDDEFDWIIKEADINSDSSAPRMDHTRGEIGSGHYLYVTTDHNPPTTRALIETTDFESRSKTCLHFWFNFNGQNPGTLTVSIKSRNYHRVIWQLTGKQAGQWPTIGKWLDARVQIPRTSHTFTITIEVVVGKSGYVAIDDILFDNEKHCSRLPGQSLPVITKPPTTTIQTTPVHIKTTPKKQAPSFSCDFTDGFCGWIQDKTDDINWKRTNRSTRTIGTGPSTDHTTHSGYYIYIESSHPTKVGDVARLVSPKVAFTNKQGKCLTFWYNMHGETIGTLSVLVWINGHLSAPIWKRQRSQGSNWLKATVNIQGPQPLQVIFEANSGNGFSGDIALDDIKLNDNPCNSSEVSPLPSCDFESTCNYKSLEKKPSFPWIITSSSNHPNISDHTYNTKSGEFMYVNTTGVSRAQLSRIETPVLQKGRYCLEFFYRSIGNFKGYFAVFTSRNQRKKNVFFKYGAAVKNEWTIAEIQLSVFAKSTIIFQTRSHGMLAVDDIVFKKGNCPRPGTCDFERGHLCFWTNDPSNKINWVVHNGKTPTLSTGPTGDHTKRTASGIYGLLESSYPAKAGDSVKLVSQPLNNHNVMSCFEFWYFMKGKQVSSLSISIRSENNMETTYWRLLYHQGNVWHDAQVPLPPSKTDFQIVIEGTVGGKYGDIAIDDLYVSENGCGISPKKAMVNIPTPTPPIIITTTSAPIITGDNTFNCTFENGTCGWVQSTTDNFNWTRHRGYTPTKETGPQGDHTTGRGYYMYMETSIQKGVKTAELMYIADNEIPGMKCMQFWYSMRGSSVGRLNIYIITQIGGATPVWTKSGTQGPAWNLAKVEINATRSFKVLIEGVKGGGFSGDIALDDVSLQNGGCKEPYGDCDFEQTDMCGYKNDPTGDFQWVTKSGQTFTRFTGPKSDHTYGTAKGHYVYIEASRPRKQNDIARMISPIYKAVPDEQCLQFYYNMYGKDVGALNVRIRVHDLDNTTYETDNYLQIVGEQGTEWVLAEVELPKLVVENPYQLIFEGVTGTGVRGDIAIDDIIINYGECEIGGDCDFDYAPCTWTNVDKGDDFDWMIGSGKTSTVETGPLTDHTQQTSKGFYLYVESSFPRKPGQTAWYVSQEFPPIVGESRCLSFWYSMNGSGVGTLRVLVVFQNSGNNTLWELHQDQGNGWLFAQTPIKSPTKYKIIFEAVRGNDHKGDIAIDDIQFTEFSCSLKPDLALPRIGKQTLPSITGTTPSPHVTGKNLNCTFDTGMCGWKQDTTDNFDWRENNGPTFVSGTGPNSDHNSNGTGFYLYIPSAGHHFGDKARLISPLMDPNGLQCLTVWYHMYGSDISTFNVYIFTGPGFPAPIFTRFGSKTNNWHRADIQFNSKSPYNVILEAYSSYKPKSEIAVDDVSIVNGHCQSVAVNDKMFCNFEERNICNFTLESDNRSKWELNKGKLHIPDHTYRTLAGHFMFFLRIPGLTAGQYASLSSPIYNVNTKDLCVNFWYYMSPLQTGMLTVSYLTNADNFRSSKTVFTRQGAQDSRWLQAFIDIDVSRMKQIQVQFFGFAGNHLYEVIGLDDVTIASRSCRRQKGACDFEKGLCNWVNRQDDDFDWTIGSGLTTTTKSGPIKDFTPGTQSGSYLYIQPESDFLYEDKDSSRKFTILESETFDQKQLRCFQFHYYMKGAKDGGLEVLLHSEGGKTMKPIWRLEGDQGDEWKMAQILLPVKSNNYQTYQVIIKGFRGQRFEGQVAIDELQFTNGFPCRMRPSQAAITSITTTPLPTSQIPIVGFDCTFDKDICGWKRDAHSKFQWSRQKGLKNGPSSDHTGGGFFLYIDSTNMAPRAVAAVMSPNLTLTTQRCLSFYYYMAGEDLNTLSVVFRSDDGNETLWKREGPQGNQWNYATINLPQDDDGFNGIIQLTGIGPNVAASGFMAVDDITLQYGECKLSPKSSIIDCDFESSNMCGYKNGKGDTSDWIRNSGEERSDNDDPDSDHTYGTGHGHYMYFKKPAKMRAYSAMLWTPKFTAKRDACLTFWYRMSGQNVGSLKISFAPIASRRNRMDVVWMRRGDQGPSWNKEYVNIGQDKDLYALFEATTPGRIAIDDVKLMHSCAEPGDCSFEKDTCGWHNANNNDLDWQRLHIRHITYYRHLPNHDHTNPDEFGHYMFFTSRNYVNPGMKADLLSVSFDPTSENGLCFEFWFIIYGIHYGNLTVYKESKSSKNTIVWHLTKSKGHSWSRASFHVKSFEPYQITVRAVKGKGSAGYIAIDDINYSTILCAVTPPDAQVLLPSTTPATTIKTTAAGPTLPPSPFDCTFEDGLCQWTQATDDKFDWMFGTGLTETDNTGPLKDHTLGTSAGHYLYIETSNPRLPNDTARLVSPAFQHAFTTCFSFWFHMYGEDVDSLNVYLVDKHSNRKLIWTRAGTLNREWYQRSLNILSKPSSRLVIEAIRGQSYKGDIAIDDIKLQKGHCSYNPRGCNFENGDICDFAQAGSDNADWSVGSASVSSHLPKTDHTRKSKSGHFMYVDGNHRVNDTAKVLIPLTQKRFGNCVTFWYNMNGSIELNVYSVTPGDKKMLKHYQESTKSTWVIGNVQLRSSSTSEMMLEAKINGKSPYTYVAIDDVKRSRSSCGMSGDCSFEYSSCYWQNENNDNFDWVIKEAGIGQTGPTIDHTLQNSKGSYFFIEGSSPQKPGDKATIRSPYISRFPMRRCLKFWYSMHGGQLEVKIHGRNMVLWRVFGSHEDSGEWKYAQVPLILSTFRRNIAITGTIGTGSKSYIALDDITFQTFSCNRLPKEADPTLTTPRPTTPPSTPTAVVPHSNYDCSFEHGYCSWTQSTGDDFDWVRARGPTKSESTGPDNDHTTGTASGWYVYIEASRPRKRGDTALLVSPLFKDSTEYCFIFYYYMFGRSIGEVDVILNPEHGSKMTLWTRINNHGQIWKKEAFKIPKQSSPFTISFRGVIGSGTYGDIALDDIRVSEGECQESGPLNCTFETIHLCGYGTPENHGAIWKKHSLGVQNKFLPQRDHTLRDSDGTYMFFEPSSIGQAQLVSSVIKRSSDLCMSFYYQMFGKTNGYLAVYQQIEQTMGTPIWINWNIYPTFWKKGQITLVANDNYKVIFEGKKGNNRSSILIDDISTVPGVCPEPGNCNFETNTCTWMNMAGTEMSWRRGSGKSPGENTGPTTDHTKQTDAGHYMFIEALFRNPYDSAWFRSMSLPPTTGRCMRFWYHMYGKHIGGLEIRFVDAKTQNETAIWYLQGNQGNKWSFAQVAFASADIYYMKIIGTVGVGRSSNIAFDDITFTQDYCATVPITAKTKYVFPRQSTTTAPPTWSPTSFDCNFESGLCSWQQGRNDDFDWKLNFGSTPSMQTGPTVDHTLKTKKGHYIFIETSSPQRPNDKAHLESKSFIPTKTGCLQFWYFMYGPNVDTLTVYIKDKVNLTAVWTRTGTTDPVWHQALVPIHSDNNIQIVLEGRKGPHMLGDIAIDDIAFSFKGCGISTDMTCGFEDRKICDFHQSKKDDFDWKWITAWNYVKRHKDHTFGISRGHYMVASGSRYNSGKTAILVSSTYTSKISKCVEFWYYMFKENAGTLNVYSMINGTRFKLWSRSGNQGDVWSLAQMTVTSMGSFQIEIEAVTDMKVVDISIDDFGIFEGECPKPGNCDFEKGWCTWNNKRTDDFDWQIGTGYLGMFGAPHQDHTTDLITGHFIFLQSGYELKAGSRAELISEVLDGTFHNCMTFWYYMSGAGTGTLNIYTVTGKSKKLEWTLTGAARLMYWAYAQLPLHHKQQAFKVLIEGIKGESSRINIAIDDIFLTDQNCRLTPRSAVSRAITITTPMIPPTATAKPTPVPTPYDCTFEKGMCLWKQDTNDNFDWIRSQGPIGSNVSGPIYDHTRGDNDGWYVYTDISEPRDPFDKGSLIGPHIKGSQDRCVNFWYHMYGSYISTLSVILSVNGKKVTRWTKSGNQGDAWWEASFTLAAQPQTTYQVIFEGSRSVLTNGQIAIDDIRFTKNKCQADNPTYCDFETGFCGYTRMKTADFNWTRAQGKTPTFFTGPYADHTTGTPIGYYIYMDATAKTPNQKAQLISPQYNSTSIQCLHFYYHMFGAHINELNVYRVDGSHIGEMGYPMWSRKFNQGNNWFEGQATVTPGENYHIIFEGKVGDDSEGDIAIDDIYQTPGACQPPGFCDFEKGLCTWTNSKVDEFDWLRNKGYTDTRNTGPSSDHTLGTPEGYYIYIETSNPQAPGDAARFQSEDFLPSNTSLCLRFWYQMNGKDVDTLNVLVRDSNVRGEGYLWSQKGDNGPEWLYAQLNVDPVYTNKPFHLILEGVRGSGYDGDIAIDDVEVSHGQCAIMPGYADPKTIALTRATCSFEDQNVCEWQQNTRDDFDWIIHKGRLHVYNSGPKAGRTGSEGYYIYTHSIKSKKGYKAILSTPTLGPTSGKGNCFTFYYHMYGMQVGTLNIYTVMNEKKTLRWTKSGNQGGNWNHANFNIDSKFNYKVYIESVSSGGYYDIIALDDIAMDGNPCPPARICDFDLDICGWTPQPNFDTWTHATNPTPIKDHSTGTTTGGFLYTNSSVVSKTPTVFRTMSPPYPPATRSCLKFWYSMQGRNPGSLNVYVKLPYTEISIWKEQGNQGTLWWHAHVEVGRPKVSIVQPYKFIFESVHPSGPTSNGIIMIDDVEHLPGPCSNNGLCDFEQDFCGFTNVYGDNFDWIRGNGKTDSKNTGPLADHTLKSPNGHYAFIEGSAINKGQTGLLTSWVHPKTTASCFQFWYNMYGRGMGALNVYLWSPNDTKLLWQKRGNQGQRWLHMSITVASNTSFSIVFEAVRGSTYASDIAIDDVTFLDGSCETQTTPSVGLITQPPTPASMLRCGFERGFCGWKQDSTENADWILASGFSTSDGPQMDHTKDSKMGSYIMLNSSRLNINRTARLMSDIIYQEQSVCLTFWYHMNGGDPGTLNVYVQNSGEKKDAIWTKFGDQGIAWRYSEIEIAKPKKTNKIYFEAVRGSGIGDVSLDDIDLLLDNCPPRDFCDFEEADICGYEQGDTDIFDWSWGGGKTSSYFTGPRDDHTYGSKYGHYMYISTKGRSRNDHAHLYSPVYPATSHERCLSFWYYMYGKHVAKLNVYLYQNNRFGDQIWSMQLDQGRYWHLATVPVTSETPFQIVFEGIHGNGLHGDIAIDDVKLSKEACDPVGFCTFEEGTCGWENLHDIFEAKFDWQRTKASNTSRTLGPSIDHTIGDRSGFYMLANVIHRKEGDSARLKSQTVPLLANSPTSYCFHFWYDVYGIDIGELKVDITYHAEAPMTIWSQKGLKESKWRHGMVGIDNPYSHFEVVLVAVTETGSRGYIALDDLQLKAGKCPNTTESTFTCKSGQKISSTKVCDFMQDCPDFDDESNCGSCVFEDSMCTWQDSSIGQYNWTRVQGVSDSKSKKMNDHTTSTDKGWFVRVGKSGKRYRYSVGAVLQNRALQKTSSTCQLKFWYYMAETYYSSLSLGILEGGRVTELWKQSHNHGRKWNMAVADIGKISRPFKLQFSVSSIFNRNVEIAIDDIELQDCNFPGPVERCGSTEYQCKQMGCVDKSRVCDLSDDCGDESDEIGCQNFTSCDFENSLCDWTQDTNDDFDWSRLNGATYTQESGPSRDHSKGTASGYYIYAEASPPRKKGDKTRLISPVFNPPKDEECWIRFFYHMKGLKMGSLNVYTRTSLLGTYSKIWKKYGHQGDVWEKADVKLTSQYNFQVLFEAEINGASSDIALDDITLTPGCHLANPKIRLPNGTKTKPTPSPCHSGLFQCKSSECLLQSQVCDFTQNCKDGSDEDICGNCDFETINNCGWNDQSTGRFRWQRHEGDSPGKFGPKKDHTTQSISGKYLMVLGSQGVFETRALLETRPFGATSSTCQAEFYVFMMGIGVGEISLNVIDPVTETIRKQVAKVIGNQGGEWKRIVGTIGAQPAGFSLQFEALPNVKRLTFGTSTDMAIDDVRLFNCGPKSESTTSQRPPLKITTGTTTPQRIVSTKKVQPVSKSSLKPIITSTTTKNIPPVTSTPAVSSKVLTSTVPRASSAVKITSTPKGRQVCGNDSFSCPTANHLCFPFAFRCDGYADCPDNYDEENCVVCPKGQSYCIPKRKCITSHRCDGHVECPDYSDETACKECRVDFCINGEMCTMENGLPECLCKDVNSNFRCVKIKTAEPLTSKRSKKVWVIPFGVVLALIITAVLFTIIYLFWIRKTKSYTPDTHVEGYTNPAYDYGANIPTDFSMQDLEPSFDDPSLSQSSPTSIENPLYGN